MPRGARADFPVTGPGCAAVSIGRTLVEPVVLGLTRSVSPAAVPPYRRVVRYEFAAVVQLRGARLLFAPVAGCGGFLIRAGYASCGLVLLLVAVVADRRQSRAVYLLRIAVELRPLAAVFLGIAALFLGHQVAVSYLHDLAITLLGVLVPVELSGVSAEALRVRLHFFPRLQPEHLGALLPF